jgi:hypothetical protein
MAALPAFAGISCAPRQRNVATFSVFCEWQVHDPLGEMNMLPAKPKKITTAHSRFDSDNNKLL